jgi:uncharacterized protein DUF4136
MKSFSMLLLATGIFTLASCSTPAHVDTGTIHASSFSFVTVSSKPAPDYADKSPQLHAAIQQAISNTLSAYGVRQVPSGGDLTVRYLVIVGNNASTTTINDYFGYTEEVLALENKAHSAYTGANNPNYFQAGTLLIDLLDSRSYKLLKRGYATRPILRDQTADRQAARIQEVVDEILADLKVQH